MATAVVVQLDPSMPDLTLTLEAPAGATIRWVKDELCRQDWTGETAPDSIRLRAAGRQRAALLDDSTLFTIDLNPLTLVGDATDDEAWETAEEERRREQERAEEEAKRQAQELARRERERAEEEARRKEEALRREQERAAEEAARRREQEKADEESRRKAEEEARRERERAEEAARRPLTLKEKQAFQGARIAFCVHGSRGDFQPCLALALGLLSCQPRPEVKFWTDPGHCKTARQFGLDCAQSMENSMEDFLTSKKGIRAMTSGDMMTAMWDEEHESDKEDEFLRPPPSNIDWFQAVQRGLDAFRPTLILYNDLARGLARHWAMSKDVPAVRFLLQPHGIPSNELVPMQMQKRIELDPDWPILRLWIMLIQWDCQDFANADQSVPVPVRETPESWYDHYFDVENIPEPVICAYSKELWPAPYDWPRSNFEITGGWKVSKEEQARRAQGGTSFFDDGQLKGLTEFLKAGSAPAYIGWGSMMVKSREYMTILAVEALRASGQRGIVLAGWAGLSASCIDGAPNAKELREYCRRNVLFVRTAPHEWLFPQCACAVHHGGIGTTQASLGAGLPTVVTPIFCDQYDIGAHVAKIEVGLATEHLSQVSPADLGMAIFRCCSETRFKKSAKQLAERMAREDGVTRTREMLQRFVANDIQTGAWRKKHLQYKESLKERRRRNHDINATQWFKSPEWTDKLGQKFLPLAKYWSSQDELFRELEALAAEGQRLWYVESPSCLVRSAQDFTSEKVGRFLEFALLEQLALEGGRLHVRRRKGIGPSEGWISTTLNGKEIVRKVTSVRQLWEIVTRFNQVRYQSVRLGRKRPGH